MDLIRSRGIREFAIARYERSGSRERGKSMRVTAVQSDFGRMVHKDGLGADGAKRGW